MMIVPRIMLFAAVAALACPISGSPAQRSGSPAAAAAPIPAPPYAEVADIVLRSPTIIDSVVRRADRLKGPEAAGVPAGKVRLLVQADVQALIRGADSVPARVEYVVDMAPDARGRVPKLRKQRLLLFARPVPGKAAQVQLTGEDSQRPWTPALDALTRRIATEALAAGAPPIVTGVGNAFHVPGSLPGESETQIFLTTRDGRPVSLNILRRPGELPRWAVALSEIVDEAAAPPARDTLLWYRLACALPDDLPTASLRSMDADNAAAAREDYRLVIGSLGPCNRGPTPY